MNHLKISFGNSRKLLLNIQSSHFDSINIWLLIANYSTPINWSISWFDQVFEPDRRWWFAYHRHNRLIMHEKNLQGYHVLMSLSLMLFLILIRNLRFRARFIVFCPLTHRGRGEQQEKIFRIHSLVLTYFLKFIFLKKYVKEVCLYLRQLFLRIPYLIWLSPSLVLRVIEENPWNE